MTFIILGLILYTACVTFGLALCRAAHDGDERSQQPGAATDIYPPSGERQ